MILSKIINNNSLFNMKSVKNILKRWFYIKIFITIVILVYAYNIIHKFDTIKTYNSTKDIVEQNKIKFKHNILFGEQHGICVIISTIWSMIIVSVIGYLIITPELNK